MYGILPSWLKAWLFSSTVICSMDVAFTMLRPDSLRGGRLGKYFFLWHIYADVDLRYAQMTDPMTQVTGLLMCLELALNVVALFTDMFQSSYAHSLMAAFAGSALVFWKTAIYLCLYLVPILYGGQTQIAEHIPLWKQALVFWLPNCVWVFVPLLAMIQLWKAVNRGWSHRSWKDGEEEEFEGIPNSNGRRRFGSKFYGNANGRAEMCCAADELEEYDGKICQQQ